MRLRLVIGLIGILFSGLSSASLADLPSHCSNSSTHAIKRPVISSQPQSTFSYRFSVSERENPDAPLLIFVPGGPGQTSMDMALSYPYEFAIVRTDPRGVGCNENLDLPTESLTSIEIAKDILGIVRELKPKAYFIHGISYGTIPATMAAALADEEGVPRPAALILEGTIGRPFLRDEYLQDTLASWQRVKARLPDEVVKRLSTTPLPFGATSKQWAAYLSSVLVHGVLPNGVDFALDELQKLRSNATEDERESLRLQMVSMVKEPTAAKVRLARNINCREFVPDVRDVKFDYDLSEGNLVAIPDQLCAGVAFDHPFDSRLFQSPSPIYYFSGSRDPVTPPVHARYHATHQSASRIFVTVPRGGHHALSENLSDCSEEIWLAILNGQPERVRQALSGCAFGRELIVETK